jgi:hypothetical protein
MNLKLRSGICCERDLQEFAWQFFDSMLGISYPIDSDPNERGFM